MSSTTTNTTSVTVSSGRTSILGLKSSMLNQDIIDQLKEADEKIQISPLTSRLETNASKQEAINTVTSLVSNFKSSLSDLVSNASYEQRSVTSSGSGSVTATVTAGAEIQSMNVKVNQLAQKDVYQTAGFASTTSAVAENLEGVAKFDLSVGGESYSFEVSANTTLQDLADEINRKAGSSVEAKVLNVGGENPYRLIVQSKETGTDNAIKFSYADLGDEDQNSENVNKVNEFFKGMGFMAGFADIGTDENGDAVVTGRTIGFATTESYAASLLAETDEEGNRTYTDEEIVAMLAQFQNEYGGSQIQAAQNAKFNYNGVTIERASNTVSNLIDGVTLKLNKVDDGNDSSEINVTNNAEGIVSAMSDMVSAYNGLVDSLASLTSWDSDEQSGGALVGVNEIKTMRSQIKQALTKINDEGKSMMDYGFSLDKTGHLSVDEKTLTSAISDDYEGFKKFFGSTTEYENVSMTGTSSVAAGTLNGTLNINGKKIKLSSAEDATAEQNAKYVMNAINAAGISNVTASISDDGKLIVSGKNGESLEIGGTGNVLASTGLKDDYLEAKSTVKDGFFNNLNDVLNTYVGTGGTLLNYADSLSSEASRITAQKEKLQTSIDTKYSLMQTQFSKYETIMSKLTAQFEQMENMFKALQKSDE